MKIDSINIAIIRHLRNGRESFKKIAKDLGVSENTVRGRVNHLIAEGVLNITGLVNPEKLPGHKTVIIGVKLSTMNLLNKAKEFSRLKGVVSACVVTGRFDIILTVLFSKEFRLLDFISEEVSKIEEIQSIETFVVFKGYNMMVPYLL
jgi:Lrp/AsnC family transcriptional regulator for asnA, asnC and gidA